MARELSYLSKLLLITLEKYERGQEDLDILVSALETEISEIAPPEESAERVGSVRQATDKELRSKIFDSAQNTDRLFSDASTRIDSIARRLSAGEIRDALDRAKTARAPAGPDLRTDVAEHPHEKPTPPDVALFFAKEFALNLDHIASGVEGFDRLNCDEIEEPHFRRLLLEAHRCYLYGFDYACAIWCGAILEEALRTVLRSDAKLDESSWDALQNHLLTEEQYRMADEVRELRNDAAHNPVRFVQRSKVIHASMLANTRAVLVALNPSLGNH
jgi:hypothetical protein